MLTPLVITSLYYAFTDNSCVHQNARNMYINIFTYLIVDSVLGVAAILLWTFACVYSSGIFWKKNNLTYCTSTIIFWIGAIFRLAWTIVGSVLFWERITNRECNNQMYEYMCANIIIRYVTVFIVLINIITV
jgi:hypothetical protein